MASTPYEEQSVKSATNYCKSFKKVMNYSLQQVDTEYKQSNLGSFFYLTDLIMERASAARYRNLDSNFEIKRSLSSISSKTTAESEFGLLAIDFNNGLK